MSEQNYSSHAKYYLPHHVFFYLLMLGLMGEAAYQAVMSPGQRALWIFLLLLAFAVTWLSYMVRQHYALGLQDRIIRVEMRARYRELTGAPFGPVEEKLRFRQIAALRFASDEELPGLVRRALDEGLSPDAIKRAIGSWRADRLRV